MRTAAVLAWLATAGGGLTMVAIWAAKGGLRQEDRETTVARSRGAAEPASAPYTNLSHWMVATHALLAFTGLALFAYYLANRDSVQTGVESAPWLALGTLLVVAALGVGMARRWAADRKAQASGTAGRRRSAAADQAIPAVILAAHGLAAAATVVLVLLVALRIGT
ncbi:MAG: hypothetical protein M3503_04355 [Actinomycetota bacterium]|nr:hypothetical protein [Actinomycetota bacterium]